MVENMSISETLMIGGSKMANAIGERIGEWFDDLFSGVVSLHDDGNDITIGFHTLDDGEYGKGIVKVPASDFYNAMVLMALEGFRYMDLDLWSQETVARIDILGSTPVTEQEKMLTIRLHARDGRVISRGIDLGDNVPEEVDLRCQNLTLCQILRMLNLTPEQLVTRLDALVVD